MKKILILLCCLAWVACQGNAGGGHDHADGHEHGHAHEAEEHDHAHDHGDEEHDHAHGHGDAEAHDHGHGEAEAAHAGNGEISLPAEKARAAGVESEAVEAGKFRDVIAASGRIVSAPGDEITVVAAVAGTVSFPRAVTEGSQVAKGASLLVVSSDRLLDGDPVERARVAYETARAEYERARKLVDERIVSQKDFETIRKDYETARIAYEAIAPDGVNGGVAVKAPMGGYVKSCAVKEGDYVTVGQPLMTLSRNRSLYLKADVSERYYPMLKNVATANFRPASGDTVYRLSDLGGRMLAYGRNADDASSYIPVTFAFDNRIDAAAGSFAEVWLLSAERDGVVSLPVEALTEEQGVYFVYIQLDDDCYRKQEVKTGATDGERVEIVSGLAGGERVVTKGVIHVKLASASNAIPAHTHNH